MQGIKMQGIKMQGIGGPQAGLGKLLHPGARQQEVVATGLHHAQPLAADLLQGHLQRFDPAAVQRAAALAQGRGGGELQQHPVTDPEIAVFHLREPGLCCRVATVVVKQRHQQAGVHVETRAALAHRSPSLSSRSSATAEPSGPC